jgi:hypothetical protein
MNRFPPWIEDEAIECPSVQREKRPERCYEYSPADRVARLHSDGVRSLCARDNTPKRLPAKVRVLYEECTGVECVSDKVGPIVSRVTVPFERVGERME